MSQGKSQVGKVTGEGEILTHEETLRVLSEMAKNGSVTAAASLERALRAQERPKEDDLDLELDRILTKK